MKKLVLFFGLLLVSLSQCFALIEIGIYGPGTHGTNPNGATFEIAISPQSLYLATPAAAEFNLIIFAPTVSLTGSETFSVLENNINGGMMGWAQEQTYPHEGGNTFFVFTYSGTGINLSSYGENNFVLAVTIGVTGANDNVNWAIADENSDIFIDPNVNTRSSLNLLGVNQLVPASNPSILPLELLYFQATAQSANQVQLDWKTTEETNVSHFEIERSYDGQYFSSIGKESAKNIPIALYQAFDDSFHPTLNLYYRLKMEDMDGSFQYSPKRRVSFEKANIVLIYPNPATTEISVESTTGHSATLHDFNGRILMDSIFDGGNCIFTTSNLSSGAYLISIKDEHGVVLYSQRMILE